MPGGPEVWIVLIVIVLLFGGSQLPKLARSLGEAKKEFERGQDEPTPPTKTKSKTDATNESEDDQD